ncbi:MAG: hypothetical protein AAFR96_13490 [Planctomycetota bacterium]
MPNEHVLVLGLPATKQKEFAEHDWWFAIVLFVISLCSFQVGMPALVRASEVLGIEMLKTIGVFGFFWMPVFVFALGMAIFLAFRRGRIQRMSRGGCWKCGYTIVAPGEAISPDPRMRKCPECFRETRLLWIPRSHAGSMRRRGFAPLAVDAIRIEPAGDDQGR